MSGMKQSAVTAVLAAVYAVVAQFSIPFPGMPLTFQCFAVVLGAYVFGTRTAFTATVIYIALGAVGVPVFAGFRGGIEVLLGATGGFIWGFLLLAVLAGLGKGKKRGTAYALGLTGLVLCNALGVLQYGLVTGSGALAALLGAVLPYILKDCLLVWAALVLSAPISAAVLRKR